MKNIITQIVFIFFVFFILSSCAKDIVDLTGNISGTVKDYSGGQFIENCKVSLSPGGKSTTTASNGVYEFNDLQPGDYTLSFSKAGYNDESTSVTVVAGQTANVSAMLKAKSAFALSETVLDFGDLESSKIFYAFNNSDADCSFTISNSPSWLSLSQERGTVKAGSSESISATIDRNSVGYGDFSQTLNVAYSGKTSGSISLIVRFTKVQLTAPKVLIADKAENITQNSFDIKGTIEATGGSPVTSYGHCWSTSANPTVNDNKTTLGSTTSTGPFTSNITNLATFTTYYVRAYATNDQGTTYSQQISVTTQDVESDKWDGEIAKSFAGGKGTSVDPYIIKTGGQLLLVKDYKDKYFELGGNINLDNHNWLPYEFKGSLDGKGYIISNLKIERTDNNVGLFSKVSGGKVKNVTIKGVKIKADESSYVGTIAGNISDKGSIIQCNVFFLSDSKISGKSLVGGIVGHSYDSEISGCHISSSNTDFAIVGIDNIGGIAGEIGELASCGSCESSVNIAGSKQIGGIAGTILWNVKKCRFNGTIKGENEIGGIVGNASFVAYDGVFISECSVSAEIYVSTGYAGGLAGRCGGRHAIPEIVSCYSNGNIYGDGSGVECIGGLVGGNIKNYSSPLIQNSFSTIISNITGYLGFGGGDNSFYHHYDVHDSAIINKTAEKNYVVVKMTNCSLGCTNITSFLKETYSEYSSNWNFNNTWIWEGTIDGKSVKVSCPKLAWE